jgi:hypothetical protein
MKTANIKNTGVFAIRPAMLSRHVTKLRYNQFSQFIKLESKKEN